MSGSKCNRSLNERTAEPTPRSIPGFALVPFLLIAFAIAWGVLGFYIFLPELASALFGELSGQHPLFYLAVWSPAIAAILIVLFRSGVSGLGGFLGRLGLWRCSPWWWAFLLLGLPVVFIAGAEMRGTLRTDPFPVETVHAALLALFFAAIKGPLEEIGWRGLALPILQRWLAPLWAGIILGIIWGIWHLPAFFLGGTQQSQWAFAPFFLGCIALSTIVTPLFNSSGGSILLTAFFHYMVMNPLFPAAEPYDTYILVVVAAAVVWLNRGTMLTRQGSITEVVPQRAAPGCGSTAA